MTIRHHMRTEDSRHRVTVQVCIIYTPRYHQRLESVRSSIMHHRDSIPVAPAMRCHIYTLTPIMTPARVCVVRTESHQLETLLARI